MNNSRTVWYRGFLKSSLFVLFCSVAHAEDSCLMVLGTVDPASAAALSAKKQEAQRQADEKFQQGLGQKQIYQESSNQIPTNVAFDPRKQDDAQYKPEKAGEGDDIGGKYSSMSSPIFAAGAAKAAMQLNFTAQSVLTECAQRRGAQGTADQVTAEQNKRIAQKLKEQDPQDQNNAGYKISVIRPGSVR